MMCWAREARLLCSVRHPSGTNQRWELYLRQWLNSVMATAWWAIPFELGNVGPPRVNSGVKNQVDRLHAVSFSLLPALDRFPTSPSRLWNGLSSGQSYTIAVILPPLLNHCGLRFYSYSEKTPSIH
jgi:hypothetical protein